MKTFLLPAALLLLPAAPLPLTVFFIVAGSLLITTVPPARPAPRPVRVHARRNA